MKQQLATLLATVLLGAVPSQADLIAGSVRDQHGVPIEGARVTVFAEGKAVGIATTAGDGTFVFDGPGSELEITCRFCRAARIRVGDDGIATAVVTRYDALAFDAPTPEDLGQLSSAGPSALLQLVPFVVVNETSRTIEGMSATDRNATPYGGLLVLDGAPDYDLTANVTPFDTLPQGGVSKLAALRVDQAYRYGDVAQGGTFALETTGGASLAALGSDALARIGVNGSRLDASASISNANVGVRAQRVAGAFDFLTPGASGNITMSTGSGYASPQNTSALFSSFSSATAQVRSRGSIDAYARLTVDRGSYAYTSSRFPDASIWSDSEIDAGVESHAMIAPFVRFDLRQSSGSYLSAQTGVDPVAGSLSQARATAGIAHHSDTLDLLVAMGNTSAAYAGILGPASADSEGATDGVASVTYRPASHWSLHASTSSGYTLQTFLGIYVPASLGAPYAKPVVLGHTNEGIVEYSDAKRLRIDATALSWAANNGITTSSAGASIAWQIAPNLSLRSWLLRESSSVWAPDTVGSAWLTFANADTFRADVVWGRSLLDRAGHDHLEGTVSGRLSRRVDWFAASAYVRGTQQNSVGIRIH